MTQAQRARAEAPRSVRRVRMRALPPRRVQLAVDKVVLPLGIDLRAVGEAHEEAEEHQAAPFRHDLSPKRKVRRDIGVTYSPTLSAILLRIVGSGASFDAAAPPVTSAGGVAGRAPSGASAAPLAATRRRRGDG
eukprot:CAMPEP_0176261258 /NCGR_PEP_ID=MMETSP0121_2-20121125/40006_1 /TAXON_ID=160619 /ORGANISM="Kryptoperidinium foliaceum, Strain CCMP 1326" /LENGTH=133 /DNA_ID=CAMNT_0017601195 /DNA_START=92 /DNA_END=492 /DNA_ORIENTATION=-